MNTTYRQEAFIELDTLKSKAAGIMTKKQSEEIFKREKNMEMVKDLLTICKQSIAENEVDIVISKIANLEWEKLRVSCNIISIVPSDFHVAITELRTFYRQNYFYHKQLNKTIVEYQFSNVFVADTAYEVDNIRKNNKRLQLMKDNHLLEAYKEVAAALRNVLASTG